MSSEKTMPPGHPHGAMRRDEREITDPQQIEQIIRAGKVMYLALSSDNVPFLVPVFYAWDGQALYFHSARSGTKINILKKNNQVCFAISLDHGVIEDQQICDFEARHRTVIGLGEAEFIEDMAEKIAVLDRIVAGFSAKTFQYPEANLKATLVTRINILSMKGKSHGF
ncbi:pyridoxamine 5'-phosphate oxidase family protein [Pantoea sp. B65]|uniref:pyridoxamine 5'-phosphate oxidase family protein n=1 Tax=Pantoea sp. B65 TaxID=2813359 RepID=UPI0039B5D99A